VLFVGPRSAVTGFDADGAEQVGQLDPAFLVDLFLGYRGKALKGFTVGVGAYNLFAQPYSYAQPYHGYLAPLAARPREFLLRLAWEP